MTKVNSWTFLFRIKGGHKYFKNQDGRIGVADDSGPHPDACEGTAPLYIQTHKPISIDRYANIPVVDEEGHEFVVTEFPGDAIEVARKLRMMIEAHGFVYEVCPIHLPPED